MMFFAALSKLRPALGVLGAALFAAPHGHSPLIHLMLSFGLVGVFLVSIVDSSFVPLPVPGITDIMVVVMAAQHANVFLLILASTAGSFLGGYFSYKVGHAGGLTFVEKHVSPRIFKRVCNWMEKHAIVSVALPAVLPPPMPLSPFVLAAGALQISIKKFLIAFTASRCLRHALAAWLGIHYGRGVLHLWNMFTQKWGTQILIGIWSLILIGVGIAFWRIYKTTRQMRGNSAKPANARA